MIKIYEIFFYNPKSGNIADNKTEYPKKQGLKL